MAAGGMPAPNIAELAGDDAELKKLLSNIGHMAQCLSGSRQDLWYDAAEHRPLKPVRHHGDAALEDRAIDTVRFLFSLFNISEAARRPMNTPAFALRRQE